ncbi:MAG: TetR/AcrR family transcriptional regulator [Amaricoccus sp.]|uniref:TetR/AcrR family transcriptional regulator n=1 Tax=Amaricoccus sp. TaxID=1872485 RepID=UPI0039E52C22
METKLDEVATTEPEAGAESVKRRQILDGARRVFLSAGFAAASMGEIAREARVSKGTLYVYFDSKEALFAALIEQTRSQTAERLLDVDATMTDVRAFLKLLATRLLEKLSAPMHVSMVRMVMGASEKFPELARKFYDAGPGHGQARLAGWIAEQHASGRLNAPDADNAAWQFIGMCCHPVTVRVALGAMPPPDAERIEHYAEAAVTTFLAAYGPR